MADRELPSQRAAPTRVLVIDDHRTFTDLVCLALGDQPDFDCVSTAQNSADARIEVTRHRPGVVLMDVDLATEDGLELAAELLAEHPDLRIVVLTAHVDAGVMRRAAAAGACALLPKDGSLSDLLSSLRNARQGDFFVHPSLLRTLVVEQEVVQQHGAPLPELTPQESRVLQLLAEGRSVNVIASVLGISVNTCRGYVKALLSKLGAHSQLEAVVVARTHGLVDAPTRR